MTEQDVFNIAEWIVYNYEVLNQKMTELHITDAEYFLFCEAKEHYGGQYTAEELKYAFDDEKLLVIIDLYFRKERNETDSLH